MKLTSTSNISFNIFINDKLSFSNENIFFTTRFVKCWNDPIFYEFLEKMDVCTELEIPEKNIKIFKN